MIRVAQIGYGRDPDFELMAPGQTSLEERIAYVIKHDERLREACIAEGIEKDWGIEVAAKKVREKRKESAKSRL